VGEKYFGRAAKMRTINIIVEGPTEEEFVTSSIAPYLEGFGIINAVPIPLETSTGFYGGDIRYSRYRDNAIKLLISDPNCIVTSLIDFYELRTDFPGYVAAFAMAYRNDSVQHIEQEISLDINNPRLVPYIQLHEFEGLLFADIKGFQTYFPKIINHAQYIINQYPNPEMINDSPATTPAARLKEIFSKIPRRYDKPFHGPMIALANGITPVLAKCPRFKNWIDILIAKSTAP
jgi:hypothetical protein